MGEGGRVATVTFAHLTDIGRVRARNEDFLGAFEPDDPVLLGSRGRLFVVADGMGGHARGDVASRIAVETLHDTYYEAERAEPLPEALRVSVQIANEAVYRESRLTVGERRWGRPSPRWSSAITTRSSPTWVTVGPSSSGAARSVS